MKRLVVSIILVIALITSGAAVTQSSLVGTAYAEDGGGMQGKEHTQPLKLIHEGMATMGVSALGLSKTVKQGPEKNDIVGKGQHSHQGTSWEMSIFPKRGPDLPTMSSLNVCGHTPSINSCLQILEEWCKPTRTCLFLSDTHVHDVLCPDGIYNDLPKQSVQVRPP